VINEFDEGLGKRRAIYISFPQAIPNSFVIDKRGIPPCRANCPAGINVQGYVTLISKGKFHEAFEIVRDRVPFPAVLSRVCFHPCEEECERGKVDESLSINGLKRFVADLGLKKLKKTDLLPPIYEEEVAIIGSGPAGLAAAYDLVKIGYPVTVFESSPEPGGMLRSSIPHYRLPKDVLDTEIGYIEEIGVKIITGVTFGKEISINELFDKGYKAVLLAFGAQKSRGLPVEGGDLKGILKAIEFLTAINSSEIFDLGENVAIIGGGNAAIDAARTALRLGSKKVDILYRRSREEMPASPQEVVEALGEGVKLRFLTQPIRIIGVESFEAVECLRMMLGEPDRSGRRRPIPIEGSEHILEYNTLIVATGQVPDLSLLPEGLDTTRNTVSIDPFTFETSLDGVFAAGDVVSGPSTVIEAIASGKGSAVSIHRFLRGGDLRADREKIEKIVEKVSTDGIEIRSRQKMPSLSSDRRLEGFDEIELGFSEEMALEEADRCLSCGGCCECLLCESSCEADAIDHNQREEYVVVDVGSIIVSTGFEVFDAKKKVEYGYGRYSNVITGLELERLISASGPTAGHIERPSDGEVPKKIAFIQCVGSRDEKVGNLSCSRVCCMFAIKQAVLIRDHVPGVDVHIYYMDIRAFGKGFEEFYNRAMDEFGVSFTRGSVSEVLLDSETDDLIIRVEDTETGELLEEKFNMVVLSIGLTPPDGSDVLAGILNLPLGEDGFFNPLQSELSSVVTQVEGIFLAGSVEGPKDIPDSVAQASAAAMKASRVLSTSGE
jgi:heterodisulfide reductase subunit A